MNIRIWNYIAQVSRINFVNIYRHHSVNIIDSSAGLRSRKIILCWGVKKKDLKYGHANREAETQLPSAWLPRPQRSGLTNCLPAFQDLWASSYQCFCRHTSWSSLLPSPHPSKACFSSRVQPESYLLQEIFPGHSRSKQSTSYVISSIYYWLHNWDPNSSPGVVSWALGFVLPPHPCPIQSS